MAADLVAWRRVSEVPTSRCCTTRPRAGLVRLYSDHMHAEYGDVDSDHVFSTSGPGASASRSPTPRWTSWSSGSGPAPAGDTLHMLPHARAAELIRSGMAIEVVAKLLTHRSTTTSQTYVRLDLADVRAALRTAPPGRAGGGPMTSAASAHPPPAPVPPGSVATSLVEYLFWMASSRWAINTRPQSLTFLNVSLDWGRRHGILVGLSAGRRDLRGGDEPPRRRPASSPSS